MPDIHPLAVEFQKKAGLAVRNCLAIPDDERYEVGALAQMLADLMLQEGRPVQSRVRPTTVPTDWDLPLFTPGGMPTPELVEALKASYDLDPKDKPYKGHVLADGGDEGPIGKIFRWKSTCLPHNHGVNLEGMDLDNIDFAKLDINHLLRTQFAKDSRAAMLVLDGHLETTIYSFNPDGTPKPGEPVSYGPGSFIFFPRHGLHDLGPDRAKNLPGQDTLTFHFYSPRFKEMWALVRSLEDQSRCSVCRMCENVPAYLPEPDSMESRRTTLAQIPSDEQAQKRADITRMLVMLLAVRATERQGPVREFKESLASLSGNVARVGDVLFRQRPI